VSEDEAAQAPGHHQHTEAGRHAVVAGRDVIFQNWGQESQYTALHWLNASDGADLLAELSTNDQTLRTAKAELTGNVSAKVAAAALRMLSGRDEDLVIALLASIPETTAESLVRAMEPHGAGLDELLTAIEAVNQCESHAGRVIGKRAGRFMRARSARGTRGFLQSYANGAIHWSPEHGAIATTDEIARYHQDAGGSRGLLGFPVAAAVDDAHPRTGTECTWQSFEGPADYGSEVCAYLQMRCGATVISSPQLGTYGTWGGIGELFEIGWRDRSWVGLPVGEATPVLRPRPGHETGSGWRQPFESGTVYSTDETGAIRVPRRWADYLKRCGDAAGPLGFPVSPDLRAAESPQGTKGHFQRFEGPWEYPEDILSRWSNRELPGGATIYHSRQHGAHAVAYGNGILYERLNGTASWLGFPTSDEMSAGPKAGSPERTIQRFEGGAIFYAEKYDSVPVRREILDCLAELPCSMEQLGFPIREAEPLTLQPGSYIQFFEHGIATSRDNEIRVWLDPRSLR
jgi:hypothetical protein